MASCFVFYCCSSKWLFTAKLVFRNSRTGAQIPHLRQFPGNHNGDPVATSSIFMFLEFASAQSDHIIPPLSYIRLPRGRLETGIGAHMINRRDTFRMRGWRKQGKKKKRHSKTWPQVDSHFSPNCPTVCTSWKDIPKSAIVPWGQSSEWGGSCQPLGPNTHQLGCACTTLVKEPWRGTHSIHNTAWK